MTRPVGIVLLVVGLILLVYGLNASDSLASSFSKMFSGAPTNKSIWLLITGGVLSVLGVFSLFGSGSTK